MYSVLKEISELAHRELNENGNIGYTMPNGKYHLFIYVEDSGGEDDTFYIIEANRVDEDGCHIPIETTSADYDNFEELLIECVRCITHYFDMSSNEMIDLMRDVIKTN